MKLNAKDTKGVYHLNLLPEHISNDIFLVGDQRRVSEISKHFDRIEYQINNREFVTHTGYIGKKRISVISTGIGNVKANANKTSNQLPRNFPSTRENAGLGDVIKLSSVPDLSSSDHDRIVIAAIRKISRSGSPSNRGRTSAIFRAKKTSSQKKLNKTAPKNAAKNRYAEGLLKKLLNSLPATC